MDIVVLASITDKLNHHQGHLNNMLETFQNLITGGAESGDILAFDGTNWRASSGTQGAASAAQSTADGAASAASAAQSTADGAASAAGAAQSTADGAASAASAAQSTADGAASAASAAQSTADGHTAAIAANTAKVSCPVWVPATDPGYPVYTVATGATDFVNMVTVAPNNVVAASNTGIIKMFSNTTASNNFLQVNNSDSNNVLIGDPNNAEGTDNVEITFTLSIPFSGVTKIVVGTGNAYLASINGGAFFSLSGTSESTTANTLYDDSTNPISLRSIAIKRIETGRSRNVRWNYVKVNDVLLVDGVTPSGLTYSESYIANAVPSAHIAAIAANTAAIAANVTSPVWVPTLDPGYAPYTVLYGANDFENMVTYGSNVVFPNVNALVPKMFDNTTSGGSYAEFSNNVADGNDNIEVTFTLVTPITAVTKIVVGTGYIDSASINGGAFSNVADTGFPRNNTLYDDSTTPINLTSITLKRTLNNQTGGCRWSYIRVNDVILVRNQHPVGLNYVIDTYIDNALPSATEAAITANTAKLSCPAWVPATDPGYLALVDGSGNQNTGAVGDVLISNGTSPPTWQAPGGPFTETSGNDWENTGTSANQIIIKHTSNQFRGINFVDNSNNGDAGLRWWKNSIGSSNTNLTQGGTQKAEIFMGDASANWQFHNWHGDGNNHGNTDFYGGGDGDISGANSHRPILRISPSHPTTDKDTPRQGTQRYTDVAYWSTNKWGKVMIGAKDNHTSITRPTFALDVRGECNIGDTAGDTQNSDGGTCSYRIGSKIVVPALGTAGQVLTVNSGGTAAEWATAAGGSMTPVYAKQYLPVNTESFPAFSTYYVFGNFTASSRLAIAFESPSGLGLVHSPNGDTGGVPKNGYFKIPTGHAGLYNIHVSLSFQLNHRTARIQIYRTPTGGSAGVILEADNTLTDDHDNHFLYNVHGTEQLADGDILHVECYTYSSSSTTVRLHGRATKNFFEIFKIA